MWRSSCARRLGGRTCAPTGAGWSGRRCWRRKASRCFASISLAAATALVGRAIPNACVPGRTRSGASARWLSSAHDAAADPCHRHRPRWRDRLSRIRVGCTVDDLVLWGVCSRGRRHVRELRAFSYMEHPRGGGEETPPTSTVEDARRWLAGGGGLRRSAARRSANWMNSTWRSWSEAPAIGPRVDARARRVCGGCASTRRDRAGRRELTVSSGDGYGAMMMAELPHAVSAYGVFREVSSWLG